jgi:hypothetical protein
LPQELISISWLSQHCNLLRAMSQRVDPSIRFSTLGFESQQEGVEEVRAH